LGYDREAKAKWLTTRIAACHYKHGDAMPVDAVEAIATTAAECIMALSLVYDA
jgi:hypothetical protein